MLLFRHGGEGDKGGEEYRNREFHGCCPSCCDPLSLPAGRFAGHDRNHVEFDF